MKLIATIVISFCSFQFSISQKLLTPETLWSLGRVHGLGISKNGKFVIYTVTTPDISNNTYSIKTYSVPIIGGNSKEMPFGDSLLADSKLSPDGKLFLFDKEVKINSIKGSDFYPGLKKSEVYIYSDLEYRHWDKWNDGTYSHVFYKSILSDGTEPRLEKDIMINEPYYCPQRPSGGIEDYIWHPDSKHILYVSKKKAGKAYASSTNTDIYEYDINTGKTINLTDGMMGYDINPTFSANGTLAWLSMKHNGNEADKQDIVILRNSKVINLTQNRNDIHVLQYKWSFDGKLIYFFAPINGTVQLFRVSLRYPYQIDQLTNATFEIKDIIGDTKDNVIVSIQNINKAAELYTFNKSNNQLAQLTHVNDSLFNSIKKCNAEIIKVSTIDNKPMSTWIIYPPDFDKSKKYPALLFCLGGPQSNMPLYLFGWNFQLMASQGYIIIAPERRGALGEGKNWTQQISKNWSGRVMQDYLSAVDELSKKSYIDKNRIGCIGASFGGFSVFMLESLNQNRFKTFISQAGIFDLKSMYGTTDELWFENWEMGGNYWDKNNKIAQRSYTKSPDNFVSKWKTPIMIIQGGKDYRVPVEQGLQAFQAAQLKGLKSKLLYFPDENHFIQKPQNALIRQNEFFLWLSQTL